MQIYIFFYVPELDPDIFLGACGYEELEEFKKKIKGLCQAHEWSFKNNIKVICSNLNYLKYIPISLHSVMTFTP